jgi:transcriptional regulator with XRE-family HTH domain
MNINELIKKACKDKGITLTKMLVKAGVQSGDYYQALNGKKTFFPAWRKRISDILEIPEYELFPEYYCPTCGRGRIHGQKKKEVSKCQNS